MLFVADATNTGLPAKKFKLTFGSPPYLDRRTYDLDNGRRGTVTWIDWMILVAKEGLRVTNGPVMYVVNGSMKDGNYRPAIEGLVYEMWKLGHRVEHPLIWSKNGTFNRRNWWSNQWEYIITFLPDDLEVEFDWEAIATPQKHAKGGGWRQRGVDGKRRVRAPEERNALAHPFDIIRAIVGGGHMGDELASENEAPFPESLPLQIIPALTRPGDPIYDQFCGGGTTPCAAELLGRQGWASDLRQSQVNLATYRRAKLRNAMATAREQYRQMLAQPAEATPGRRRRKPSTYAELLTAERRRLDKIDREAKKAGLLVIPEAPSEWTPAMAA